MTDMGNTVHGNLNLHIGERSENGQVTVVDEDRLCYIVRSVNKGAEGLRTISKALLGEFVELYRSNPNLSAVEARDLLSGKSELDKFEYGYNATLWQLAKMAASKPMPDLPSVTSPRQIIYYGAPGTGKSHKIKAMFEREGVSKANIFRTTFHPDSDYSTFVGAYKPTRGTKHLYGLNQDKTVLFRDEDDRPIQEPVITYQFVPQVFLQAYIRAYAAPAENVYLVIEEINRGNCAQIFGDLFQLLDRDEAGRSDYTVKADSDMRAFLEEEFKRLGVGNDGIADGELCLPSNLYIYATMNTSDQSLFPIDSAFKRRWDWEYEPIKYGNKNWRIVVGATEYSWVSFQKTVNKRIWDIDNTEDKMLGDYFVNPQGGVISEYMLLNKVLFYLWSDVCKDGEGDIFKTGDGEPVTFSDLHRNGDKLKQMMEYLGVEVYNENSLDGLGGEDEGVQEDLVGQHPSRLKVDFPNNSFTYNGVTYGPYKLQSDVYVKIIEAIGVDRVAPIIGGSRYHRRHRPLISNIRYSEIDSDKLYGYEKIGEYYVIVGIETRSIIRILNLLSEQLGIDLIINQ